MASGACKSLLVRPDGVSPTGIRELELQEQTISNAGKDQVWQVQTSISHHPVNFSPPSFPLEEVAEDIKSRWASLQSHSANQNHGALFWRLHCVETNLLEGTFALTREVSLFSNSFEAVLIIRDSLNGILSGNGLRMAG